MDCGPGIKADWILNTLTRNNDKTRARHTDTLAMDCVLPGF